MLYTQKQLISYAAYCLKQHGIKDDNGNDLEPGHGFRTSWEETNNVQPIQVGQIINIETIDGLKISAEIEAIEYLNTL